MTPVKTMHTEMELTTTVVAPNDLRIHTLRPIQMNGNAAGKAAVRPDLMRIPS